jgi:uncharacterized damage-inducible protein DinB
MAAPGTPRAFGPAHGDATADGAPARLVGLAASYLEEYSAKIALAIEPLDEAAIWWRANERSNSIGNLLLHLAGNLSQWVLGGLLGRPVTRRRSAEFAARAAAPKAELLAALERVVAEARAGIAGLGETELARKRTIQGYRLDGYAALFHAVEHMSYHTGQIVLLAKARLPAGQQLEFYPQHQGE